MQKAFNDTNQCSFIAFQSGEEKALDYYFKTYYKAVCFFAKQYIHQSQLAEDITSESFIKLWENRDKIESEAHLRNWLYQTVWRRCKDERAKERTKQKHEERIKQSTNTTEEEFEQNIIRTETMRQLHASINLLPPQCKKIFFKLYVEGKTAKETAKEMQLSISTIDNQKARGIKLLQKNPLLKSRS